MGSKAFAISKEDLIKVGKGAGIAVLGVLITYGLETVIPMISQSGTTGATVGAIAAIALNAARKWLFDTTGK